MGVWAVNNAWNFQKDAKSDVVFTIDERNPIVAKAIAVERNRVIIPLDPTGELFGRFRHGNQLQVFVGEQTYRFNLTSTSKGLAYLADCVDRYTRVAVDPFQQAPRVATSPAQPTRPVPSEAAANYQAEAMTLAANMLGAAGVSGFQFVAPHEKPEYLRKAHVVWRQARLIGSVQIVPERNDVSRLSSELVAADQSGCGGKFATASSPETSNGVKVISVSTACQMQDGGSLIAHYNLISRSKGGLIIIGLIGTGETSPNVEDIGAGMKAAIFQTLAR